MKRIFLFLLFSLVSLFAEDRKDVAFIHGLMGDKNTWNETANKIKQEYYIEITNEIYDESARISPTADSYRYKIPNNSVGVAHSMGGLLAREIIRKYGNGDFSALITIGAPHKGAQIAVVPGNASSLLGYWLWDIAFPWYLIYGSESYAIDIAQFYVQSFFNGINIFVDATFDLSKPSMSDLAPSSSFLNTLNNNPNNTFPDAHYTIWGDEDWMMPWRLGDTFINNKETGDGWKINKKLQAYYFYFSSLASDLSRDYHNAYLNTWNIDYWNEYMRWLSIAHAFYQGAYSLAYYQQIEWDYWVTGSYAGFDNNGTYYYWKNDAIVPIYSQAPDFVSNSRYLQANHANHIEEHLPYGDGYQSILEVFDKPDVNVPKDTGQQDPLSVYISGPTHLEYNQSGTFTANPSGGSKSYTDYSWWWRSDDGIEEENGIDYVAPGYWFELTYFRGDKTISLGKPADFSVKCEVTDSEGNKDTNIHSVQVSNLD